MSEPFLGEIKPVGFNFAPRGYALCEGQLISIAQNTALFALLGTTYGGNGINTFALPDLRGRVPIGFGQGPGLSDRSQGEFSGSELTSLSTQQMPAHNHSVNASGSPATSRDAAGNYLARAARPVYGGASSSPMAPDTISSAGGSGAHENMQPSLVVNYIIALEGIFPPRG